MLHEIYNISQFHLYYSNIKNSFMLGNRIKFKISFHRIEQIDDQKIIVSCSVLFYGLLEVASHGATYQKNATNP